MNCYTYDEITVGLKQSFQTELTDDKMKAFLAITGDENPLHNDDEFARSKNYPGRVVYGMLLASLLSTLAGMYLPGKYSLIHSVEVKFVKPLYLESSPLLTVRGEVVEKSDVFRLLKLKVKVENSEYEQFLRGKMKVGVIDAQ
jgi:3-hydroxybutyryl-CoA dehydratase